MSADRSPSERQPGRMAPLSTLPLFFSLAGRRVVLAGGGAPALWKAELLAATGAAVTVLAQDPLAELSALDGVALERRSWRPEDLAGAALAVGDLPDEAEAARFAAAARAAGVPVNVIDRPAFCDFSFGAIVNRDPVVVGIGTGGAAPVLGQAIRARLEALLPPTLGAWARAAGALRHRLARLLPSVGARRAFWARAAEGALAGSPDIDVDRLVAATSGLSGRITLVGAGPGDPGLLTLEAVRALGAADIVLFDDLVAPGVLELARREARRIAVGKRGHRASCRQEAVTALAIRLAREGHHVVRLKSGDPMIFGRAGEEIAAFEAAGLPVRVVPGVTAALAAAARLRISLTHRELARSVRFLTAHASDGRLPETVDWCAYAEPGATLMVYMGGHTAPALALRLIGCGLDPATPAVVLEDISGPGERLSPTTVGALAAGPVLETEGPLLIGIGHVFAPAALRLESPLTATAA